VQKFLSGDGIEVTGNLAKVLVAKPWWRVKEGFQKRFGDRKSILLVD
jgi:hypothetical protein